MPSVWPLRVRPLAHILRAENSLIADARLPILGYNFY
jgi:hypothetical protein